MEIITKDGSRVKLSSYSTSKDIKNYDLSNVSKEDNYDDTDEIGTGTGNVV